MARMEYKNRYDLLTDDLCDDGPMWEPTRWMRTSIDEIDMDFKSNDSGKIYVKEDRKLNLENNHDGVRVGFTKRGQEGGPPKRELTITAHATTVTMGVDNAIGTRGALVVDAGASHTILNDKGLFQSMQPCEWRRIARTGGDY